MKIPALFAAAALLCGVAPLFSAPMTDLELTSGDFTAGGSIPHRCTCEGSSQSPSLRFAGLPERTKSLALLVDDPDAPGGEFTHWIVWGIQVETKEFTAGTVPNGVKQGVNDFGKTGYGAPCPPSGEHRYRFHLYALDGDLQLPATARRKQFTAAIAGHILGEFTLTGRYEHGSQ